MHNKRIMLLALGVSGIACGQQPKQNRPSLPPVEGIIPGGSIAGKPIPDHVFAGTTLENAKLHVAMNQNRPLNSKTEAEAKADMVKSVCLRLNGIIYDAAEKRAITDLGITVTREDIATARASIKSDPVASSNWLIERAKLMISALTAVDQGQDAHQLYALMLQPKGIMEAEWELYRMQWKNPQGRARLEQCACPLG